jgi:hypothetical protein
MNTPTNSNNLVWGVFLAPQLSFILFKCIQDYFKAGNPWKQGDWLINSQYVDVRRGLFGDFLLFISDFLTLSPLTVVISTQVLLLLLLANSIQKIINTFRPDDIKILLFILPTFIVSFWANDPQGSMRKELLLLTGLAMMAAELNYKKLTFNIGLVICSLSVLAHEINILLAPFAFYLIFLTHDKKGSAFYFTFLVLTSCYLFSIHYNFTYKVVSDTNMICTPLLERGLNANICNGAIKWLNFTPEDGLLKVKLLLKENHLFWFLTFSITSSIIWLTVSRKLVGMKLALLFFMPPLLAISPLYIFAVDWGRWISTSISVSTILLIAFIQKKGGRHHAISWKYIMGFGALFAIFSPHHILGLADSRSLIFILPAAIGYLLTNFYRRRFSRPNSGN